MDYATLFSPGPRAAEDSFRYSEPEFSYLDRSPRIAAARVRRRLQRWYMRYPADERAGLRQRFRSRNNVDHYSSFFELFVHELLLRLGCDVQVHPELPNRRKRPDFIFQSKGRNAYLEASVVSGESRQKAAARARIDVVYDVLDRLESPNFFVGLHILGSPATPPDANAIMRFLRERLAALDPDEVAAAFASAGGGGVPRWRYEDENWVEFFPVPRRSETKSEGSRPLGIFMRTGWSTAKHDIRKRLAAKAGRYGELDQPYVVALNVLEGGVDEEDTLDALFGTTQWNYREDTLDFIGSTRNSDGFWLGPSGPKHTRVSAVLIVRHVSPWRVGHASACLYHNPWAAKPYESQLARLPEVAMRDGKAHRTRGVSFRTLFRLPVKWPEQ